VKIQNKGDTMINQLELLALSTLKGDSGSLANNAVASVDMVISVKGVLSRGAESVATPTSRILTLPVVLLILKRSGVIRPHNLNKIVAMFKEFAGLSSAEQSEFLSDSVIKEVEGRIRSVVLGSLPPIVRKGPLGSDLLVKKIS
jgi:hypothetical protein